jgi:hypothetical protein
MRQGASRKPGEPIPSHRACWWPPREKVLLETPRLLAEVHAVLTGRRAKRIACFRSGHPSTSR